MSEKMKEYLKKFKDQNDEVSKLILDHYAEELGLEGTWGLLSSGKVACDHQWVHMVTGEWTCPRCGATVVPEGWKGEHPK